MSEGIPRGRGYSLIEFSVNEYSVIDVHGIFVLSRGDPPPRCIRPFEAGEGYTPFAAASDSGALPAALGGHPQFFVFCSISAY